MASPSTRPPAVVITASFGVIDSLAGWKSAVESLEKAGIPRNSQVSVALEGMRTPIIAKELMKLLDGIKARPDTELWFGTPLDWTRLTKSAINAVALPVSVVTNKTVALPAAAMAKDRSYRRVRIIDDAGSEIPVDLRDQLDIKITDKVRITHITTGYHEISTLRVFIYRKGAYALYTNDLLPSTGEVSFKDATGRFTIAELMCSHLKYFRWLGYTPYVIDSGTIQRDSDDGRSYSNGFPYIESPYSWDLSMPGDKIPGVARTTEQDGMVARLEEKRRTIGLNMSQLCSLFELIPIKSINRDYISAVRKEAIETKNAMDGDTGKSEVK